MIYALILFACIDGFVDFAPDVVTIEVQSRTKGGLGAGDPIETGSTPAAVPCVIVLPVQVREEVQAAATQSTCKDGNCRVEGTDDPDDSTCNSGCASAPTRPFRLLRRLFRR